ncbi:MAG: helix-turn-helix domain-containing protein [Xanthomonadaceae bacterium]|jgi:transcriptional regulator with XRE-family HTH domain|nr:helix-turn-helix domain-containing protein [Xanthomonadaceae bacterium]
MQTAFAEELRMALSKREQIFYKRLGKEIAKQRTSASLTQEQLGEKLDIGSEAVSRIERGTVAASAYKLYRIADIVGCNIQDLLLDVSRRTIDQADKIAKLLEPLSMSDRQFIVRIVEQLSARFQED